MSLIMSIFWINFIIFIWFKTDFIVSYSKLFKLNKLFKVDKFEEYKNINPTADYLNFLRINHKGFFIKLISCVPCLMVWISLFVLLIYNVLLFYPMVYVLSYTVYKILNKYVY